MMQYLAVTRSSPSIHRFSPPLHAEGATGSAKSRTNRTSVSFGIRSPVRCVLQSPSLGNLFVARIEEIALCFCLIVVVLNLKCILD